MAPLVTDDQLTRYMGQFGLDAFADHDDNGSADTGVIDDCKTYATGYFVGRLINLYPYSELARGAIVPELVAIITLRELCVRRGNAPPASLEVRYQEIDGDRGLIDRILAGKIPLVDTNGERLLGHEGGAPSWANIEIDQRFLRTQQRVVRANSSMPNTPLRRFPDRWETGGQ